MECFLSQNWTVQSALLSVVSHSPQRTSSTNIHKETRPLIPSLSPGGPGLAEEALANHRQTSGKPMANHWHIPLAYSHLYWELQIPSTRARPHSKGLLRASSLICLWAFVLGIFIIQYKKEYANGLPMVCLCIRVAPCPMPTACQPTSQGEPLLCFSGQRPLHSILLVPFPASDQDPAWPEAFLHTRAPCC